MRQDQDSRVTSGETERKSKKVLPLKQNPHFDSHAAESQPKVLNWNVKRNLMREIE